MENMNAVIDRMAEISSAKKLLNEEYDRLQAMLLLEAEKELTDTKLKSVRLCVLLMSQPGRLSLSNTTCLSRRTRYSPQPK
ncbi:hypothetical protein, partial [Ruminococcus flavefaciens]|uniref:hypothetical protein n=1 Tax=Ruminococcus flavefaciens TaxID=1265 RepID=UPI001566B2F9